MFLTNNKLIADVYKFAAYRRTLRELNALSRQTRADLNLSEGNLPAIAHKAVYGY